MELTYKAFVLFFILVKLNSIDASEDLNHNTVVAAEGGRSLQEQVLNNYQASSTIQNLCMLYDHLEEINGILELKYKKLFVIIADSINNGIKLAKFLSDDNRVLPETIREELSSTQQLLYDKIIEKYYVYYSKDTSTYIFVYPNCLREEILLTYLTKRTIDSAEEIKIALTCHEDLGKDALNRMFQLASNILETVDFVNSPNLKENIILLPLSVREKCGFVTAIKSLEEYFNEKFSRLETSSSNESTKFGLLSIQETLEYSLIEPILMKKVIFGVHNFCTMDDIASSPQRALIWNYVKTSSKLIEFNHSFNYTDTIKCFQEKNFTMESLNGSCVNMSTLTGVFSCLDFISSSYKSLYLINYGEEFTKSLCDSDKKLEIIKLLCHVKYMSNSIFYDSEEWIDSLKLFSQNFLQKKLWWFTRLKSMYDNVNYWDTTTVLHESQDLYEEILEIGRNNEEIMRNAFFIVRNNTVKAEANISCLLMKNGYKLQVKGTFLKLSEVLEENSCPGKVKFIELLALEKIIIDRDLVKIGEEVQVNIFAPIWEVIFNRVINLDGAAADNSWKIVDPHINVNSSAEGRVDGLPGLPGGPGGTFFGLIGTSIEGKNLQISSNGGKGGDGQHSGIRGSTYFYPMGNGGKRGEGGNHGVIKLFSLNDSINLDVRLSASDGDKGDYGVGQFYLTDKGLLTGKSDFNEEGYQAPNKSVIQEDFGEAIKRYRKYILSSVLKDGRGCYAHLYMQLNKNMNIPTAYSTLYLTQELIGLEEYYSLELNKSISSFMFDAWRQGIREYYSHRKANENTNEYTKVLLSLDVMVSRKIQKLEESFYDDSILIIDTYLEEYIKESKKLQDVEVLIGIKTISRTFKIKFEDEMKNAKNLIHGELQNYLEERMDELNWEIKLLIEESNRLIERKRDAREELKKKREELKEKLGLSIIFASLKFLFLALSFINPVCAIVGSALIIGTSVVESETLDSIDGSPFVEVELPKGVTSSMERTFRKYDQKTKESILLVERKLEGIKKKKDESLKRLRRATETASTKNSDFMQGFNSEMVVDLGIDTYNKISKGFTDIRQVDAMLTQESTDIQKLKNFKEKIQKHLEPQMEQIRRKIIKTSEKFAVSSITYLEFQNWQMDNYLAEVTSELELWTEKFQVEKSVKVTMRKLKSAINVIIRLHTLIKEFNSKVKSAEYLRDVISVPFQTTSIRDIKLRNAVTKLMRRHYANDILDEYHKLKTAFMQYTFPFVKEFPDITLSPISVFSDPVIKANLVIENMKYLKSHLNKRKAHGKIFRYTTTEQFGGNGPVPPFYEWNSSTDLSDIKNILDGKEVKLFANISNQNDLNAVKFRDVKVLFSSTDPQKSEELENDLKGFSATLTHNGDSYYRCDDKIYLIKSGAFEFGSKFFKVRKRRSVDNSKLDYVLSPYATWTIQLKHIFGNQTFKSLSKHINYINIELVGEGQFMNSNVDICKSNLTKYYGNTVLISA